MNGRRLPGNQAGQAEEQFPHPPGQGEGEGDAGLDAEGASHQDVAPLLDSKGAGHREGPRPDGLAQALKEQGRPDIDGMAKQVQGEPNFADAHEPGQDVPAPRGQQGPASPCRAAGLRRLS